MALVAASIIEPGLYFAMNTPPAGLGITMPNLHEMGGENAALDYRPAEGCNAAHVAATVSSWGFVIHLSKSCNRERYRRTFPYFEPRGRRADAAMGNAHVFHKNHPDGVIWASGTHFGILFEALFILTARMRGPRRPLYAAGSAGNPVPFLKTDSLVAGIIGTAGCVGLWGYLLYQGVVDPLGGVKSPAMLFGI